MIRVFEGKVATLWVLSQSEVTLLSMAGISFILHSSGCSSYLEAEALLARGRNE
jgi:hypothetical protein